MNDRAGDLAILGLCLGALFLSLVFEPEGEGVNVGGVSLPRTCLFARLTGHECPFCGLTRSMASLSHGRVRGAVAFNAAGPAVFIFIILQAVYRGALLAGFRVPARGGLVRMPLYLTCLGVFVNFALSFVL